MRLYVFIELLLLVSYFIRLIVYKISHRSFFDLKFSDVSFFFLICLLNDFWFQLNIASAYVYNFFHCSFAIVLPLSVIWKRTGIEKYILLILMVALNLYFVNLYFIVISNLLLFVYMANRIVGFTLKSSYFREKVPVYLSILIFLIFTQLIYLISHMKMDWKNSQLVDYFLFATQFIYLTTFIIGHVYLRRFIVN
ncbi:MAG: hypothetical protein RJA76_283 [Bacteroidota bacterium]|jgi:hypothetical protein